MIILDLSILNQKGTPMFNSDTFANRPNFGIVGRIFISTDTAEIYRDTGTSWVLIADTSSGGTITGSGTTGTIPIWSGSTSLGNSSLVEGALEITSSKDLLVNGNAFVIETSTAANNAGSLAAYGQNTLGYAAAFSSNNIGAIYGAVAGINLQTFAGSATFAQANLASAGVFVNSIDFSSASSTITMTQSSGIRAMTGNQAQLQYQGTNSGTISHAAVQQNLGFYRPSSASGILTITNAYSHLINALDDYGAGFTFTNRFGIYQAGASDLNYFAASVLIGTNVNSGYKLDVSGTGRFTGALTGTSAFFASLSVIAANGVSGNFVNNATSFPTLTVINSGSGNLATFSNSTGIKFTVSNGGNGLFSGEVNSVGLSSTTSAAGNLNSLIRNTVTSASGTSAYGLAIESEATAATSYNCVFRNLDASINYGGISTATGQVGFWSIGFAPTGTIGNRLSVSGSMSVGSGSYLTTAAPSNGAMIQGNILIGSTSNPGQNLYLNGSLRIDGQTSGSAGGNSGQHLIINLDGTQYKIKLENN